MINFPDDFLARLRLRRKQPRFVIELDFGPGEVVACLSHDDIMWTTADTVLSGTISSISSTSQRIDPDKARATIGSFNFNLVDLSEAVTAELKAQLDAGRGARDIGVRLYIGFHDLTENDYVLRTSQQLTGATAVPGGYRIACQDLQHELQQDIFEPAVTTLTTTIEEGDATITVGNTAGFELLTHGPSFTDAPSATVGYLKIEDEIVRYTGKTGSTFTGCTRGALGTTAARHEVDPGLSVERRTKVEEYIYLELPILKLAYAVLTGTLPDEGGVDSNGNITASSVMPAGWNLGLAESEIDISAFTAHPDLWDTASDSLGFPVRFEGLDKENGKKWIERELLRVVTAFMPTKPDGQLSFRRTASIEPYSSFVATLDKDDIRRAPDLKHDIALTRNQFEVRWNWNGDDFTRTTQVTDSDSVATHGAARVKVLEFKGLHGSRHTNAIITNLVNSDRQRYANPPLRMRVDVGYGFAGLEEGDTVRVELPQIRDYAGIAGTLDRVFEVQRIRIDHLKGRVSLDLFGSTQPPGTEPFHGVPAVMEDSWYTSAGTALNTQLTMSGNNVTANGALTGHLTDVGDGSAIFYHAGDLTVNAGVTVTLHRNVQLRVRGTLTVNGSLRCSTGMAGTNDYAGTPGYCGAASGGPGIYSYGPANEASTIRPAVVSGANGQAPVLQLRNPDGLSLDGLSLNLRGTGAPKGSDAVYARSTADIARLSGAQGGTGGGGLVVVARGMVLGLSGSVNVSGFAGQAPGRALGSDSEIDGFTAWQTYPGHGGGGGPGTMYVLLDGSTAVIPDLAGKFLANTGSIAVSGHPLPERNNEDPDGLEAVEGPLAGFQGDKLSAVDFSGGNHQVQFIPPQEVAEEDEADDGIVPITAVVEYTESDNATPSLTQWIQGGDLTWLPSHTVIHAHVTFLKNAVEVSRLARSFTLNTLDGTIAIGTVAHKDGDKNTGRVTVTENGTGTTGPQAEFAYAFSGKRAVELVTLLSIPAVQVTGGAEWFTGAGAPAGALGDIGDFYLNSTNGDYYEKTGATTWTLQGNLGGGDGAKWLSGSGVPSGAIGQVGDYYLNIDNGDVYTKTGASTWTLDANIKGTDGIDPTVWYVKPLTGTAIKNSTGTLRVQARKIEAGVDTLLSSGAVQLYKNGTTLLGDGYDVTLADTDINDSVVVELRNGSGGTLLDTISLVDITDGEKGDDAVFGYIEATNGLAWTRDTDQVTWAPAATTSKLNATFVRGGTEIARTAVLMTRDSEGLITGTTSTHDSGNLNSGNVTITIANNPSQAVTAKFVWSVAGDTSGVSETVSTSRAGGEGLSVAELAIWRRAAAAPSTPTGGVYDFDQKKLTTIPSGWSTKIPAGNLPVYESRSVAAITGTSGTDPTLTWTTPVEILRDGESVNIIFTRSASLPATPSPSSGVPAGWYDDPASAPGSDPLYQSVGYRKNADENWTWQLPTKVEGEDGAPGDDAVYYYIQPVSGTAIKNSNGSLQIQVHRITGGVDSVITSGSIKLYVAGVEQGTGYDATYNAAAINGSVTVELRNGPAGNLYDTITLVDVTDGVDGDPGDPGVNAVVAFITPDGALAWTQAPNSGAWTPSETTRNLDIEFWRAGSNIGRSRVVITRAADGSLTLADGTHPSGNLGTVINIKTGTGTAAANVKSQMTVSGTTYYVNESVISVRGGADGADGDNGQTLAEVACYRRDSSTPGTPTGGNYDFSGPILVPPSGWQNSVPVGGDDLWTSRAVAVGNSPTDNDTTLTWSTPVKLTADGQAVDIVFQRAAAQPSTPGSGTQNPPTGWVSNVNALPGGTDPVWASNGKRANSTANWVWEVPVQQTGTKGDTGDPGDPGASPTVYYIKPTAGTAIKNSSGFLALEARKIENGVDTLLSSGTIKMYTGTTKNVDRGYEWINIGAADITNSITVHLQDGSGTSAVVYDTITLVDITDGADGGDGSPGANAVFGYIEVSNTLAWVKGPNAGAWSPATLTTDLDCTFVKGGVAVGRHARRVTLSSGAGTLSDANTTHKDGDLKTYTSQTATADGQTTQTITFTYDDGTDTCVVSETVHASQGGDQGTDGTNGTDGTDGADGADGFPRNLVDPSEWVVGSTFSPPWGNWTNRSGTNSNGSCRVETGPFDEAVPCFIIKGNTSSGIWALEIKVARDDIDKTQPYLWGAWVKFPAHHAVAVRLGFQPNEGRRVSDGALDGDCLAVSHNPTSEYQDKWLLAVQWIYPNGYGAGGGEGISGLYDPQTGLAIQASNECYWESATNPDSVHFRLGAYQDGTSFGGGKELWFARPFLFKATDGGVPTIQEIMRREVPIQDGEVDEDKIADGAVTETTSASVSNVGTTVTTTGHVSNGRLVRYTLSGSMTYFGIASGSFSASLQVRLDGGSWSTIESWNESDPEFWFIEHIDGSGEDEDSFKFDATHEAVPSAAGTLDARLVFGGPGISIASSVKFIRTYEVLK